MSSSSKPTRKQPARAASKSSAGAKRAAEETDAKSSKRTAVSSSSSSSSSSSAEAPVYYFVPALGRGLTIAQMWGVFDAMHTAYNVINTGGEPTGVKLSGDYGTGSNLLYHTSYMAEEAGKKDRTRHPPGFSATNLVRDHALTTGQTECPLTLEPFDDPVIMAHNGRSYSCKAIVAAIATTLLKGMDLRLEDGRVITPLQLRHIKLFTNAGLPSVSHRYSARKITYTDEDVKLPAYDRLLTVAHDLPELSRLLGATSSDWHKEAFAYYARQRPHECTIQPGYAAVDVVRNCTLRDVVYPREHEKPGVTFLNVRFENCVIVDGCLCCISFRMCEFVNCVFLQCNDHIRRDWMHACVLENCVIAQHEKERYAYLPLDANMVTSQRGTTRRTVPAAVPGIVGTGSVAEIRAKMG